MHTFSHKRGRHFRQWQRSVTLVAEVALARRTYQVAPLEVLEGGLYAALREAGSVGHQAQARHGRARAAARLAPEVQVDQERGRSPIVTDQVGHERIENIAIDADAIRGAHLVISYYSS